jgi:hypothetical protein
MKTAIAAVIVASFSLVVAVIGCVIAVKTYKKSKRLEFFQRRDHLFQKISELNAKNSESHLISAKYEMEALKLAGLRLSGEYAERVTKQIVSINRLREGIASAAKNWDDNIEHLHFICSSLTSKTDTARAEKLIALVNVASDQLKRVNEISLASLHILENTGPSLKTDLDKLERYEIELAKREDLEKAKKELVEDSSD